MIHPMESEPPSCTPSAVLESSPAQEALESKVPSDCHRKDHSDRVLAFLRKYPERAESLP